MKAYRIISTIIFFALVFITGQHAFPQDVPGVFHSFGQKEIKRNKTTSRNDALKECLSDALRQYVAIITPKQLFELNDPLLKIRLYDKYNNYLKNYKIKEEKEEDRFYKITAEVELKTDMIDEELFRLGLDGSNAKKPSLVVLVSDEELKDGTSNEFSWWTKSESETKPGYFPVHEKLISRLGLMGFKNASKQSFLAKLADARISLKKKLIKGDIDTLRRFKLGDILISGTSSLVMGTKKGGTYPKSLSISIKAFDLDDGSRLSTLKKSYEIDWAVRKAQGEGEELTHGEALNEFIDDACADLVSSFLEKWRTSQADIKVVELKVTNLYSYDNYQKLGEFISKIKPEVKAITPFAMEKGIFTWHIAINGKSDALASKIAKEKIDKLSIDIVDVQPERIEIKVK